VADVDRPESGSSDAANGAGTAPTRWGRILRACLGPPAPVRYDDPKAAEKVHAEVSMTLRRVMFAVIAYSVFCFITLYNTDLLLVEKKEIKIPLADVTIGASDFFYVGPLVLIGIAVYMHIFVGYWQAMADSQPADRLPFLFNMDGAIPWLVSRFVFYWLVPLVVLFFFWTAQPFAERFPSVPPYLQFLFVVVAATSVWLSLRRRPPGRRSGPAYAGLWVLFACLGLGGVMGSGQFLWGWSLPGGGTAQKAVVAEATPQPAESTAPVRPRAAARAPARAAAPTARVERRRPAPRTTAPAARARAPEAPARVAPTAPEPTVDIRQEQVAQTALGAVLTRGLQLAGKDLRKVNLKGQTLAGANLARADLRGVDLTGTNLSRANLSGADLSGAILRTANLTDANLRAAALTSADLRGAQLSRAYLQGARGLNCRQLAAARDWETAYRDAALACGRPVPTLK